MATVKKPLTKAQISSHIAETAGITKKAANEILGEIASLAYSKTKKKGEITLPGLGKLVLQNRKARMGRNPQTGAPIKIKAKKVAKFKAAASLAKTVNGR